MSGFAGVEVKGETTPEQESLLTRPALAFIAHLHRMYEGTRQSLLQSRAERRQWWARGFEIDFAPETSAIRDGDWRVAPPPVTPDQRPATIIGPADPEAILAATKGDAGIFVACLEDMTSPGWDNILRAQSNLRDAVNSALPAGPLPVLRPRGWHLPEAHLLVDGAEVSASIVDFALYFFHNAPVLVKKGARPSFQLPKLEHYLEARLWNNIFITAQSVLGLPLGTIRATILIETLPGAFMADEILHELRDHAASLALDPEDYIFSRIKCLAHDSAELLPDHARLTPATPFLASYARHVRQVAHRRGILAIGGLPAFNPASDEAVTTADLLAPATGPVTEDGMARNVRVAIGYLAAWLSGNGARAIDGQPTNTADAETARAQLWQWRRHRAKLADGRTISANLVNSEIQQQLGSWKAAVGTESYDNGHYREAATILSDLVMARELPEFFTVPCYHKFLA